MKKNLLAGLDIPDFNALNPAARHWLDTIANQRIHGETRQPPVELFEQEKALLHPMPENLYDLGTLHTVRASNRFRVTFNTNRYLRPRRIRLQALNTQVLPRPPLYLSRQQTHRPSSTKL